MSTAVLPVNEKIVKEYAFCPREKWRTLPQMQMPLPLRDAIIAEIRNADLPPRKHKLNLEQMSDIGISWALITVWSLLFVKKALGENALGQVRLRPIKRHANS